jgi:hypothetical protein
MARLIWPKSCSAFSAARNEFRYSDMCLVSGQADLSQAVGVLHVEIEPDGLLFLGLQVQFPLQDA